GDSVAAGRLERDAVGESVHAGIATHKGVVARQHRLAIAAGEMDDAGVTGIRVAIGIQRRDGDVKRIARRAASDRGADSVVGSGSMVDRHRGAAIDGAGGGSSGGDWLVASGVEGEGGWEGG